MSAATHVIVVGAGVAGLSAATALAERGLRVTVVEGRPALGGRTSSYRDPATGDTVDNGQHILIGCYREAFALLRRIGSEGGVRLQASLEVPYVDLSGARSTLSCPPLPPPYHLLGGLLEWDALPWADRLSALRMGPVIRLAQRHLRGRTSKIAASPDETVDAWLVRNGQRPRLREMLWEPLALAALNQPASEAAAPPFVRVLAEMFAADSRAASLGLPTVPLSELFAEPARRYVEARGGTVLSNALATVVVRDDRARGVALRGGHALDADAVISAVPWHALPALLPDAPPALAAILSRAAAMQAYPIVTVNLWFDRPVLDTPFVGLPGRTMQWAFATELPGRSGHRHLSLVSSGATEVAGRANDEVVALALRELHDALPAARAAQLMRATVVRERQATFSLAPGQPARPGPVTPLAGFFLAGDWTDTGLPGTIESAAVSGHRAAAAVEGSI